MSSHKPLKLALLWHMHQPNYQEPGSNRMVMPWVRLHATKDYLDMLLYTGEYDNLRITFNLVPSLLDQFQLYLDGGTDPHLELSRIAAVDLSSDQKLAILKDFFSVNPRRMIEPYSRYFELYRKSRNNADQTVLPGLFSSEEIRDIQVWSNLAWVDPMFHNEEPVKSLIARGRHFGEEEKQALLDWQMELIRRIVPTYQDFYRQGKIDVSFTPYYHPILPLLCDTRVALDAIPRIELPQNTFRHPEDAVTQIRMSMDKFESVFGTRMTGMWPSEGSVSEEVADILIKAGIEWIATDEEILYSSLKKASMDHKTSPIHTVYEYGPGLKLFFRDHALSDRIGFVYSSWDADRAATDFVEHLKKLRSLLRDNLDQVVVPVILDGENAWEYFPDDGREFLNELYRQLSNDPEIETVTMSEAAKQIEPRPLKSLHAGSWINHNFRIWIGHYEDNAAWDLLFEARET
ncbi:MAG: glycoside hydrolase family 57 protein, partial [candidate division Zixibacteria bacterium]|nr:glycoside hydrolase family 57 protein [candidate division Zixibacteria bacterium]